LRVLVSLFVCQSSVARLGGQHRLLLLWWWW
jgi:hypothetical protein